VSNMSLVAPRVEDRWRLRRSTNMAIVRTSISGRAEIVPGSPQSGSCLIHHPPPPPFISPEDSPCIDDDDDGDDDAAAFCSRRFKYAPRDSDAAAQRSGTAAKPRGVNNTLDVPVPELASPRSCSSGA